MSLMLRKNGDKQPLPSRWGEWDPFRRMRELMHWNALEPLHQGLLPQLPGLSEPAFLPAFEVKENSEGYAFKADLPGLREEDLDISLSGDRLVVSGKREAEKQEQGDTYYTCERSYGTFTRAFTLPSGIDPDHVRADLKDGVLSIFVPKLPQVQARKVMVGLGKTKA